MSRGGSVTGTRGGRGGAAAANAVMDVGSEGGGQINDNVVQAEISREQSESMPKGDTADASVNKKRAGAPKRPTSTRQQKNRVPSVEGQATDGVGKSGEPKASAQALTVNV